MMLNINLSTIRCGQLVLGLSLILGGPAAANAATLVPPAPNLGTVDPAVVRFVKALILDDQLAYMAGEKTKLIYRDLPRASRLYQASEIWRDFFSNELSATQKYGATTFAVSGRVAGVKQDWDGQAYIEFVSSAGLLGNVRAYIPGPYRAEATQYRRAQTLVMICGGANVVLETPVLKGCRGYEEWKAAAEKAADEVVENWIAGRPSSLSKTNPGATEILQRAYDIGRRLPDSSSCLAGTIDEECEQLMAKASGPVVVGATSNSH